ncbi:helix-turn-helix domain-containing protein [Saccharopolyspora hattusasensis]|uniref:helix-turn-helix domain-containing protein n=1 Tax=Saccharopolyspora hattusasensis TaxID=1128679 RepID=UPI003D95BB35
MADEIAEGGESTFAAKLERLFEVVRRPDGGRYSVPEVAAAIDVSKQHLYDLLSGKRQRPAWELVTKLAEHFGVSVVYFGDGVDAERYSQQLDLLSSLSDAGVRDIALRSGQLSPAHRGVLKGLLDHLQSLERDQPDEKR